MNWRKTTGNSWIDCIQEWRPAEMKIRDWHDRLANTERSPKGAVES